MEEATELPLEDGEPEGSSEMPADSSDIGAGDNKEPSDYAFASAEDDMSGEGHTDSTNDWYEDWTESDFDLDEVIKELEEDVKLLEGEQEEEDSESEDEDEEDEESEDEESEDKEDEESDAEEEDKGEPSKAKFTLDEFVSMMQEAGYDINKPANPPMEGYGLGTMEETDLNLEEILAMLEAEDAGEPESEEMASEVQALQEELAEYRTAVGVLRGKLHEVNLLNAKLLYTNKIFRKEGLSNDQKVRIVENFDRATTVREVKMVYTVLAESLVPRKEVKATKTAKKIVAEGLASKPVPSTAPKANATEVIAENSFVTRFQQLAGIIS